MMSMWLCYVRKTQGHLSLTSLSLIDILCQNVGETFDNVCSISLCLLDISFLGCRWDLIQCLFDISMSCWYFAPWVLKRLLCFSLNMSMSLRHCCSSVLVPPVTYCLFYDNLLVSERCFFVSWMLTLVWFFGETC